MVADAGREAISVLLLFAVGCGSTVQPKGAPEPVLPPSISIEPTPVPAAVGAAYLSRPEGEPFVDELLASPVLRDSEFQSAVNRWIDYWENAAAPWFPNGPSKSWLDAR